jgi:hypothetical protein
MHFPPWQLVEQQSAPSVQASPSVLQAVVPEGAARGWQVVAQRPVQHSAEEVHAVAVGLQAVSVQRPASQEREQHSPGLPQAAPGALQKAVVVQVPALVARVGLLHALEQQSPLTVQVAAGALQVETGVAHCCLMGSQYALQQSASAAQLAPSFLQIGGVEQVLFALQKVEQQSELKPHAPPFAAQGSAQTFEASQWPEQHEPGADGQALPFAVQVGAGAQASGVPVQMPVQHSAPLAQPAPFDAHGVAHWLAPLQ